MISLAVVVFIFSLFAAFFFYAVKDLDELAEQMLLDELWDDEVGAGRSSSSAVDEATTTAGAFTIDFGGRRL